MSAFDWLRINNTYDFQLANRFAQRQFFKFFLTKVNYKLEPINFPRFPSFSLPNPCQKSQKTYVLESLSKHC